MISFLNLKEQLKTRKFAALCIFGNDGWLKQSALDTIISALQAQDMGVETLDGASAESVRTACFTPCMFCPVKVVVCKNFVFPQGKAQQRAAETLSSVVRDWDGGFCLVFWADSAEPFKNVEGLEYVNCDKLDAPMVAKWIVSYAKRQGVAVENGVARLLGEYCLQDMSRVQAETQKLIDYGEFTAQAVEALVHKDAEYVVYNLAEFIAAKNAQGALALYDGLISSGEDARGLFGLLYNFFRRAYYVKTSDGALPAAELLGVRPYAVQKAKAAAERYKPMQLKKILDAFSDADEKLKAFAEENAVMKNLILKIITL